MTRPTQEPFDTCNVTSCTGLSPPVVELSRTFHSQVAFSCEGPYYPSKETFEVWAVPVSLAATKGIDFSFFSSGYLDVSVHRVSHSCLCIQHELIQESRDRRLFDNFPWLFAVFHAFHRLLTPRHPPCALNNLTTYIQRSSQVVKNDAMVKLVNDIFVFGANILPTHHNTLLPRVKKSDCISSSSCCACP